jgi:hypothetical protein
MPIPQDWIIFLWSSLRDFQLKKYPKISCGAGILRQAQYKSCPLIIKDGQEARVKRVWAILRFFTQFGFIVFT